MRGTDMAEPIRVAVLGRDGRMGSEAVRAVDAAPDLELVAAPVSYTHLTLPTM